MTEPSFPRPPPDEQDVPTVRACPEDLGPDRPTSQKGSASKLPAVPGGSTRSGKSSQHLKRVRTVRRQTRPSQVIGALSLLVLVSAVGVGAIWWLTRSQPKQSRQEGVPLHPESALPETADEFIRVGKEQLALALRLQQDKGEVWDRIVSAARKAADEFSQATKLRPGSAEAHYLHARSAMILGDFSTAATAADQAAQLDPKRGRYRLTHAFALLESHAACDRLARLRGEPLPSADELKALAEPLRLAERNVDDKLDPEFCACAALVMEGRYAAAAARADRALKRGSATSEDEWWRLGALTAELEGKNDVAVINFDRYLEKRPNDYTLYLARALARRTVRDIHGAYADGRIAQRFMPDEPTLLLFGAELSIERQDYRAALEECRLALERDSTLVGAHLVQARARIALREFSTARLILDELLQRQPPLVAAQLLMVEIHLWQGEWDDAERLIAQTLAGDENSFDALMAKSRLHLYKEEFDRALEAAQRAVTLAPQRASALVARGDARRLLGDHERALVDYRAARTFEPLEAHAHIGLAKSLAATGDPAGAVEVLRQAIRLDPRNADLFIARATLIRTSFGEVDEAFRDVEAAARLDKNNPDVYLERALCWLAKNVPKSFLDDLNTAAKLRPRDRARIARILEENKPKPMAPPVFNPWLRTKPGTWYRMHRKSADKIDLFDVELKEVGEAFYVLTFHYPDRPSESGRTDLLASSYVGEETLKVGDKEYRCEIRNLQGTKSWFLKEGPFAGRGPVKVLGSGDVLIPTQMTHEKWVHRDREFDALLIEGRIGLEDGAAVQRTWIVADFGLDYVKREIRSEDAIGTIELVDFGEGASQRPPFPK